MAKMLMAAFSAPEQADRALYELYRLGFSPRDVSVISKHNKYEAPEVNATTEHRDEGHEVGASAASGAATGGVIGGLAGLLAGIGIVPALAGLFIGGPIAAALGLAGVAATTVSGAVTGAAAGGLIGALTGIGVSKEAATSYDHTVSEGGVVLGLSDHEDHIADARAIMERHGAKDISEVDAHDRSDMPGETMHDADHKDAHDVRTSGLRAEPSFGERRTTDRDL